ncbi:MAG: hypothetical protein LUG88_04930, partial [Clostridia bacterium]|nr:hypothetical protein [Clostridia bacterium]
MQAGKKQEKGDDIIKKKILILLFALALFTGVMLASVHATGSGTVCSNFYVTGGELGTGFNYENNVLTFISGGEYTVTMNGVDSTADDRIVVSASGDITLTLVDIDVTSRSGSPLEVNTSQSVTIKLSGTNTLDASNTDDYAGLQKTSTANTLVITSANGDNSIDGILYATGGYYGAGIGGGDGCYG